MNKRRVVITGLGVVAPNGIGKDAFWKNLVAGKSAVDYVSAFDPSPYPCKVAAEVRDFRGADFTKRQTAKMGRFSQFAVAASRLAVEDAALATEDLTAAGVCLGTATQGTADVGETNHRNFLSGGWTSIAASAGLELTAHAATAHVQTELGIAGPALTIMSACCTGIDSMAWAAQQISSGAVDVALACATEAPISEFIFSMFLANAYLATWTGKPSEASRPYDALRCGLVLSEGAATVVLEDFTHAVDREASIHGEVLAYGSAVEAPGKHPEKSYAIALEQAITSALAVAKLSPRDIDYICSHGNSTQFDDQSEACAHRAAFGNYAYNVAVSSIKSMIGQPFAASGLMQAVASALALRHQIIPPTINYQVRDPRCDLDYVPNHARSARVRRVLFHAHSLGGHLRGSHSAIIIGKADLA